VPRVNDRRVLNSIFWILRSGAPWRDLPDNFGPYTTCYNRFSDNITFLRAFAGKRFQFPGYQKAWKLGRFLCDHPKVHQHVWTKRQCQRYVRGITSVSNQYSADTGIIVTRVKHVPSPA
jgi:transposase